ncbi:MAG: response regulator transcription factor [Nitrospirota bacterium]|jgi:DNA-binding NarL/FixJ family response regulator
MIKILIADDHALVREGITALLSPHDQIEIVGTAANGQEAVGKAGKLHPDIILMDIAMPGLGGLEATLEIRKLHPDIKILILSQYDDKEYVSRLFKAGVSGYILKHAVGTDLVSAIRAVHRGECYLYPAIAAGVVDGYLGRNAIAVDDPYESLSDREKQVLKLIAEGSSHKEIAALLNISPKTVVAHQTNISEKLGIRSRAALIKFALQKGIVK